ncbi:hypothetical protein JTE90_013054, partial [Oedothorax gibbosus]
KRHHRLSEFLPWGPGKIKGHRQEEEPEKFSRVFDKDGNGFISAAPTAPRIQPGRK